MIKWIVFSFFMLNCTCSMASWCELNVAPPETEVDENKKMSFIKSILHDFENGGPGKRMEIGEVEALIWSKGSKAFVRIIDHKTKNTTTVQFDPKNPDVSINLSPHYDLRCLANPPKETVEKKMAQFDMDTYLTDFPAKLELILKKDFSIFYSEINAGSRMEGQYWQGGKRVSRLGVEKNMDWCFWQTQIRVNEDVDFKSGLRIPVIKNEFKDKILSLSFVDFEQAKVVYKTSRFAPFQMECFFSKENPNLKSWKDIVGQDWELVKL